MADGENTNSFSAIVFLVVSVAFLFLVHFNGLAFMVPDSEEGSVWYAFLFLPLPILSTVSSLLWLYLNHRGAQKGGFRIALSSLHGQKSAQKNKLSNEHNKVSNSVNSCK